MQPTIKVTTEGNFKRVKDAADKAAFRNFGHAAASIAKDAKSTVEQAEGPSPPGTPPHTHKGKFLSRAIRYAADKDGAVIGPMASVVGEIGQVMEFGGEFRGHDYDARPFMEPALDRGAPRFADEWEGSIGE